MRDWADSYLATVERGKGTRTIKTLEVALRHLERFLVARQQKLSATTDQDLQVFANERMDQGNSPDSVRIYLIHLSGFFAWCRANGLAVPATGKIYLPRKKRRLTKVLREQALAFYMVAARDEPEPYATIIALLPLTGLRIGEMVSLTFDDVQIDGPWVLFRVEGKSKGERQVPLLPAGKPILLRYLREVRPDMRDNKWLFPGTKNRHLSVRSVQRRMAIVRERIGVPNLTPHILRHTYATILAEAGITGLDLQKILGHENATTSARYYSQNHRHIAPKLDAIPTPWANGQGPEPTDQEGNA